MRTGIVVDASCDLPPRFLVEHNIQVLPSSIHIGTERHSDAREPKATLDFYTGRIGRRSLQARTESYPVGRIRNFFLDRLVSDFDHVICIPIWKERSPLHEGRMRMVASRRGWESAANYLLRRVARVVEEGWLASRFVCASYGGEPERMEELAGFQDLRAACEARGVKLLLSIMSAVAAVNVGAGALSVAYSGEMAWE